MKKILFLCLAAALMLAGGCSYSASHSSEASFGVNSNGKVETSASSSVYTERVENGKTVNNSASVSVGNKGASAGTSSSRSEGGLIYTVEDADLRKGEVEIDGYFTNNGTKPVTVKQVNVAFSIYDEKGKLIWEDESVMDVDILVKPNGTNMTADFVIHNPNAPDYRGSFDFKYRMEYISQ